MEENPTPPVFDIAALRLKIARGRTPAVLAELAARATEIEPGSLRNDFFLLNNRWAQLERDRLQGALTPDEVGKQRRPTIRRMCRIFRFRLFGRGLEECFLTQRARRTQRA